MIGIKNIIIFMVQLGKKTLDDDLFALSNELAYKILLSFFPFMVFLVSLLGFLHLDDSSFIHRLFDVLPVDISLVMENFVAELQAQPSPGLLSASLLVSMYSASNGFRAVMRGVNKAHNFKDERNWIKKTALSTALMLIFTFSIIVMLTLWIFGDALLNMLSHFIPLNTGIVTQIATSVVSLSVLVVATTWIYRLACAKPKIGRIFPGACATVALWAVSSEAFGIFFGRFSNISVVYGSIAGIFILIVWLNLISFFLLLGNTINALLNTRRGQL